MEQSLFYEYLDNGRWANVAAAVARRLNDSADLNALSYRHLNWLTPYFSPDLRWETAQSNGTRVMADVIALDSSIPVKRRDRISTAAGKITKRAMELALGEEELTRLMIMRNTPGVQSQLIQEIYADTARVIQGQYETNEYIMLQGLSTGFGLVTDPNNTGTAIRIDYGFQPEQRFGVTSSWNDPATGKPLSDFNRVINKARQDGRNIITVKMDRPTFNKVARTEEAKDLFAANTNFFGANRPIPNEGQLNAALQGQFGWTIEIIERSVRAEKNAIQTSLTPWAAGQVLFSTKNNYGNLAWSRLAEMQNPVAGVMYTTVNNYILVSKYRLNRPSLQEFTSSQALALPVVNPEGLYLMDTTQIQA